MNTSSKIYPIGVSVFFLIFSPLVHASPSQISEIPSGGIWPTFVITKVIPAPPIAVAATFWECERSPEYVPNCISVQRVKDTGTVVVANYRLGMPFFLSDELYQSTNHIELIPSPLGNSYKISWVVPTSTYSDGARGSILIEPTDSTGASSKVTYRNLARPTSHFAKLLKRKASQESAASIDALDIQTVKEFHSKSSELDAEIFRINALFPVSPTPH